MQYDEYQQEMNRTYKGERLDNHVEGLAGEYGEMISLLLELGRHVGTVVDMVKKGLWHSVSYDRNDMKKELGDCLWYLTALCQDHGFTLDQVAQANVDKLRKRYPEGFVKGGGIR